jgi:hypothetical protein
MAAALERIGEFALAPWWGLVSTKPVAKALNTARALHAAQLRRIGPEVAPGGAPAGTPAPPAIPARVGVSGAAVLRSSAHMTHTAALQAERTAPRGLGPDESQEFASAAHAATNAAKTASEEADTLWVKATKQRPTILLPMAALASVVCYCMHLFLLHSLAKSGVAHSHFSFVVDGLITGFAIAGGAQPFHDLIGNLTSSSTAKKAATGTVTPEG